MAQLEFDITGNNSGLSGAVKSSIGLLQSLKQAADALKVDLFKADTVDKVNKIGNSLQAVTGAMNRYIAAATTGSQAFKDQQTAAALENLSGKLTVVRGNTELFGASVNTSRQALQAYQGALNTLLANGVSPLDQRVQTLKTHIDETTAALNKQKAAVGNGGSFFGGFGGQLSGLVTSYVSLYAAIRVVGAIVSSNAEISDSLADVRRTAQLTAAEADNLFNSLKKIDTRTSLKGLVDISIIGGQLNIAKDQLTGFTRAVDALSVSLKGEIEGGPQEVAKSLGILDNLFKVSARNGGDVEKAYNQIGSTLLALGQSGLATGQFLTDFANKVGGVAAQAGIALPVLLSYGAVLQENGITAEVAGTSLNKLIGTLATKRAQFFAIAQLGDASLTLKEFTRIINTDTQQALKLFFDGLNSGNPTTTQFRDRLSEVGLEAARSAPAITALARNQERLTEEINLATKANKDGTVASDQAAIKQDTLGASVDRLTKSFVSLTTSGNVAAFFKAITDRIGETTSQLDKLINSSSWKEFFNRALVFDTPGVKNVDRAINANDYIKNNFNSSSGSLDNYIKNNGNATGQFQVQALSDKPIGQLKKLYDEASKAYKQAATSLITYQSAISKGLISDGDAGVSLQKVQLNYKLLKQVLGDVSSAYGSVYNAQKKTAQSSEEVADADLKTTKAIRQRIQELQNDALANPGSKAADILRIQGLNATLKELRGAATGAGEALRGISLSSQLTALLTGSNNSASTSGLKGLALDIQQINNQYDKLNTQLDEFNNKVKASKVPQGQKNSLLAESAGGRQQANNNRQKEIENATIKAAQDTANNIQRINDEFGVKATVSRDKEIAQVNALVDQENAKYAAGSQERIAIEAGRISAIKAINDKYAQEQDDLFAKIQLIDDETKGQGKGKEISQTAAIAKEWDKRLIDANKYFAQIRALQGGTTAGAISDALLFSGSWITTGLTDKQTATTADISKGKSDAIKAASTSNQIFTKEFDKGIRQLGSSFSNTLTTIGQQGNSTFSEIFNNLQKDITKTFTSTILKIGTDFLGDALKKGITGGTGNLSDIFKNGISSGVGSGLAAVGVGSLVGAITPKTSYVGQGAAGALAGAGSGLISGLAIGAAGGPIGAAGGAIIGGVIGLAGGLFGAKKANKQQEALQQQQLDEAKKQTALLRQQALAYTSSIIGKMTTNGVVTGVDINAFGELTATVTGKQLQFVLDRNSNSR
jgi:TP901 family phage tail tape measure protein